MKKNRKAKKITALVAVVVVLGLAFSVTMYGFIGAKSDLSNVVQKRDQLEETLSTVRNELERALSKGVPNPALPSVDDLSDSENWTGYWKSVSDNPNALVNIGFPPDFPVLGFERASKVEFYPTEPPFYSILIFIIVEFSSTEAAEAVFATYENLVAESPYENAYSVSVGEESFGITREGCPQDSVVFRNGNVIGMVAMCGDNVKVGETILRAEFLDERI